MKFLSFAVLVCLLCPQIVWAEPSDQAFAALQAEVQRLTTVVQQLNQTVQAQAERIRDLERQPPQLAQVGPTQAATSTGLQQQARASLSAFNPEIGMLADVLGQLSESSADTEGNDKLSVRELELVLGHPIDPYSRLDTTITFSDFEEPVVEEAYITHWGLPGEIKARLGRMRPKIGKASAIHRDSLETVDEPLVVTNYLGAEGLSRTGLELSGFLPLPWTAVVHELTAGVMEGGIGEGGALFGSTRRRPSFYAHLKNFWDISETSNLELGATYLVGSKDADARWEVNALGLDATFVHYVTPTNKLKWQNELYLQDRDEAFSIDEDGARTSFHENPWGLYSLVDYRFNPRFGFGGRFDYVEPVEAAPVRLARHADTAWSGHLTFHQSEFARWRLQFRHTNFASGGDDNSVFLQGTVASGVHKHQLQ
ncbi:MAG: hypothetical protein HYW10_04255 [Candidatus Omnitrophica bacterium]|nr:hypothetical protein [Candidatus Omnitrophota bacterium]